MIHLEASKISVQCLWATDCLCRGIQLLQLSAEKPYVLTALIKHINTLHYNKHYRNCNSVS